jgi:hypothetical protein
LNFSSSVVVVVDGMMDQTRTPPCVMAVNVHWLEEVGKQFQKEYNYQLLEDRPTVLLSVILFDATHSTKDVHITSTRHV